MVEVRVEPSPLPALRKGDHCRVRIRLKGGRPGEEMEIRFLGATNTRGENRVIVHGDQAVTTEPSATMLIRAIEDGTPSIIVSSPEGRFDPVAVNGHTGPIFFGPNDDWIMFDPTTPPAPEEAQREEVHPTTPPPPEEAQPKEVKMSDRPDEPIPPRPATVTPSDPPQILEEKRSWFPVITGFLVFFLLLGAVWWSMNREPAPVAEPTPEPVAEAEAQATDIAVAAEPDPEPVAEAQPEPTAPVAEAQPEPPAAPAEPKPTAAPVADPAPTTGEPTGCTFLNGNRPTVGEKYVLVCDQGKYLALGVYDFNIQNFRWSDYEEHTPPK